MEKSKKIKITIAVLTVLAATIAAILKVLGTF